MVHSSNLCAEITLNTSDAETVVRNLGSVNPARHPEDGAGGKAIDHDKPRQTADCPHTTSATRAEQSTVQTGGLNTAPAHAAPASDIGFRAIDNPRRQARR